MGTKPVQAQALIFSASSPSQSAEEKLNHFDSYAGADVGTNYWLVYSGVTVAPFSDVHQNGVRLRVSGGYGRYKYDSFRYGDVPSTQSFDVATNYLEALAGYQQKIGIMTAKGFIGVTQIDHAISPADPGNRVSGSQVGVKGTVELWFDLSDDWYASLDGSYTTAHKTRSARLRVGYRLQPNVSFGLEARLNQDAQADFKLSEDEDEVFRQEPLDYVLIGVFGRYEWPMGEVSGSIGLNASDVETTLMDGDADPTLYGTINTLFRF
ncbi:MAG: cellulose biosynthesis protein BcsS [Pseudomonadota bacterium]